MANWKYKLKIKDLLGENTSPEVVKKCCADVIKRIKAFMGKYPVIGWELDDIIDRFAGVVEDGDVGEFNSTLDELYNWADRELVWVE